MATIKDRCPTCGDVTVMPDDIDVQIVGQPAKGFYAFSCPDCATHIRKPANAEVVCLLVMGGVTTVSISSATRAVRLRDRFDYPPLTTDDLLDFHVFLQQDGWFDRILADAP